MVNNNPRVLVSGACNTLVNAGGRTIVNNGPVYELVKAQALLSLHGVRVINEQAVSDQASEFNPELSDDELIKFICELKEADFQNSERCATSVGRTIDCDAYAMKWNRLRHIRWAHGQKIYVKFGFLECNPMCLVVSIHPAKW